MPSMDNKLVIAAAGSGKTTFLVNEALKQTEKVLITTYTQANEAEIIKKIVKLNNCIPQNITVQTWFSFLLQHGVRPFQGCIFDKTINGLILVNSQSGIKGFSKTKLPIYFSEKDDFTRYYFSSSMKIYSDKLSKFVIRCNKETNGAVVDRMSRIYSHIYIDEVQDLAGYDLELIKLLFKSSTNVLLVGDPRQGTYSTNSSKKNKQYKKSKIVYFFENPSFSIQADKTSFLTNYRCIAPICTLSNKLFPDFPGTVSGNINETGHDGIFLVKIGQLESYLKRYSPIQLRDSKRTEVNENYSVMNFGESKGLTFERILIYPTRPFIDWLIDNSADLAPTSRSKLYVALTRAKYSVAIVLDYKDGLVIEGINNYKNEEI